MFLDIDNGLNQHSYYEATVQRSKDFESLEGDGVFDVCVVGGGLAGLSAALELVQRGYSVAVLEAERPGWGASGRNGGQAIVGYAADDLMHEQLPAQQARQAWDISVEGLQLMRDRIQAYDIDCAFQAGQMNLATNARRAKSLAKWLHFVQETLQYPMEEIRHSDIRQWIDSDRYHSGTYDPLSGHLHPLKYCLGLEHAARAAGVRIYEKSPVIRIQRGLRPKVHTAHGAIECEFAVLAGNVYLNEFGHAVAPELASRIMPVGTYIGATEPMDPARARSLIPSMAAVCDTNFVLDYFRVAEDHRLLFGGRVSYSTSTPRNLEQSMRQRILAVFPQLADLQISYTWGGFVDITMNRGPDFGRLGSNIYYLQGFSGHGLALTGIAGKLVAEAIDGQAKRFDVLASLKHKPFPGGRRMRMPALLLGTLYYRLRDLF